VAKEKKGGGDQHIKERGRGTKVDNRQGKGGKKRLTGLTIWESLTSDRPGDRRQGRRKKDIYDEGGGEEKLGTR